jgi:hypothetical protein
MPEQTIQLRGFESPQRDSRHTQQQERAAGIGSRLTALALSWQFSVVFPCLLDQRQQAVGDVGTSPNNRRNLAVSATPDDLCTRFI